MARKTTKNNNFQYKTTFGKIPFINNPEPQFFTMWMYYMISKSPRRMKHSHIVETLKKEVSCFLFVLFLSGRM